MTEKLVYTLYRVSTLGQVEKNDIPMQKKACKEFIANQQGWKLAKEFTEKGVSGYKVSAGDRDAMQAIIRDAMAGKFQVLLVFMFDRLGRKQNETPLIVESFIKQGIEVWSTQEGQQKLDTHSDHLFNFLRFWQAQGESEKTSIRTSTRLGQIVQEGRFKGGVPPYGYKLVDLGRTSRKNKPVFDLAIDEQESEIVKLIFDCYVNRLLGTERIANYLTKEGVRNRKGMNFVSPTIKSMLKNPAYRGVLRSGASCSEPFEHLRIVSDDLFEQAQAIRAEKVTAYQKKMDKPRKIKSGCLLDSTRLRCGHCGARLTITTSGKGYKNAEGIRIPYRYVTYNCYNGTRHKHLCNGQRAYVSGKVDHCVELALLELFASLRKTPFLQFVEMQRQFHSDAHKVRQKQAEKNAQKLRGDLVLLKEEIIKVLKGGRATSPPTSSTSRYRVYPRNWRRPRGNWRTSGSGWRRLSIPSTA